PLPDTTLFRSLEIPPTLATPFQLLSYPFCLNTKLPYLSKILISLFGYSSIHEITNVSFMPSPLGENSLNTNKHIGSSTTIASLLLGSLSIGVEFVTLTAFT